MKWSCKWHLSLLLAVFLSSCGLGAFENSVESKAFEEIYSDCEINTVVQFLPPQQDVYKTNTSVNLNIHNTSPEPVIFPHDFSLRIVFFDTAEQVWRDIKNDAQYLPLAPLILDPVNSGFGSYEVVSVFPVLSDDIPISARVVVSGNISDEDGKIGKCVGAYTDILITP